MILHSPAMLIVKMHYTFKVFGAESNIIWPGDRTDFNILPP